MNMNIFYKHSKNKATPEKTGKRSTATTKDVENSYMEELKREFNALISEKVQVAIDDISKTIQDMNRLVPPDEGTCNDDKGAAVSLLIEAIEGARKRRVRESKFVAMLKELMTAEKKFDEGIRELKRKLEKKLCELESLKGKGKKAIADNDAGALKYVVKEARVYVEKNVLWRKNEFV